MAAFQISTSIEINRPSDEVFNFIIDIPQLPAWSGAFDAIRDYSGEPVRVGTTWVSVNKFMGREMISDNEVVEFEEDRICVVNVNGPAFSGTNTWAVEANGDNNSVFTISADGEMKGFLASLATGLIRNQAQSQMNGDLKNLKSILEV